MKTEDALEIIYQRIKEENPMSKGFTTRQDYRKWLLDNPSRIEGIAECIDKMQCIVSSYCKELDWFYKLTSSKDPEFEIWKAMARINFLTEMD